jgi:predicted TIM-barrel fold metal-dependent hydrolase
MGNIIDFRARPNTPERARYLSRRTKLIRTQAGTGFSDFRAPEESLEGFVAQLDAIGIDQAVFAARNRKLSDPEWTLTNAFVADCVNAHPSRIIGFAGVDAKDPQSAATEAALSIEKLGLLGVCFDPFALDAAPDDPRFDPIYDTCARLGVPAVVTLGGWPGINSALRLSSPLALDAVARRFPDLILIGSHAGWPFTTDMIAAAWRCENLYFENSFYHFAPGADLLVQAANSMIGEKMLYASAYPFVSLDETLQRFQALPFSDQARENVLGANAARLIARIRDNRKTRN